MDARTHDPFSRDHLAERELPAEVQAAAQQTLLRFLTCGSVDDGKSTLIGRLLYETGSVFDDQLEALERDSKRFGTDGENIDFALLVDGLSAEREQGITIDVAYRYFSTSRRAFIVADTPGHEQYTRNMATGASTADVAILLVDARKGLLVQTRRHAFIASLLRVPHVILAVNKMDLVDFDKSVFDAIVADFASVGSSLGFASVTAIPLCARTGDNVTARSHKTPWYDGAPLLEVLESIDAQRGDEQEKEFLFPVQWVNRPDHSFRGFSGSIASGTIAAGEAIVVLPSGRTSRIAQIVTADGDLDRAVEKQAVTLVLEDEIDISRGDVIARRGVQHVDCATRARGRVIWTGTNPAHEQERYVVQLAGVQTQARITDIHHAINIESYTPEPSEQIAMNAVALVSLQFDRPVPLTDYHRTPGLGQFILIDRFSNETVAIGMVDRTASLGGDGATSANTAGLADAAGRLAELSRRFAGAPGSTHRQSFYLAASWRIVSAIAVAVLVLVLAQSPLAAVLAGLADLVLRPLLRRVHRWMWRPAVVSDELNRDGGGI